MMTTQSPTKKSDWFWVGVIIALILIILYCVRAAFLNTQLVARMREICQNMSMDYSYKDETSFYCISTHFDSVTIKEIRYR